MADYRLRHAIGVVAPTNTSSSPVTTGSSSMTPLGYANLGLPSRLNVDDETDMNWIEASVEGQSVDEEFNAYDHSKRAPIDQDLLVYWGVSGLLLSVVNQLTQCNGAVASSRTVSNNFCHCDGLPSHPGLICSM